MLKEMTDKEFTDSLVKQVAELELHVKFLNNQMDKHAEDITCHFGAYLVNNYESRFEGGEDQIAKICCDFVEQLEKAN
jgi:phage gp36-like protein